MIVLNEVEIPDLVRQNVRPEGFGKESAPIDVSFGCQKQKIGYRQSFNLHFFAKPLNPLRNNDRRKALSPSSGDHTVPLK